MYLEADVKVTKMYRKGEMRRKKCKERERERERGGGGGGGKDLLSLRLREIF